MLHPEREALSAESPGFGLAFLQLTLMWLLAFVLQVQRSGAPGAAAAGAVAAESGPAAKVAVQVRQQQTDSLS